MVGHIIEKVIVDGYLHALNSNLALKVYIHFDNLYNIEFYV